MEGREQCNNGLAGLLQISNNVLRVSWCYSKAIKGNQQVDLPSQLRQAFVVV